MPRPVHCLILSLWGLLASPVLVTADTSQRHFGTTSDGDPVTVTALSNANGVVVEILDRGATVRAIRLPDGDGQSVDIVNGFDDVSGYESEANQYFGCTVGRVCNRIAGARFELYGETFKLNANDGQNTLHGGTDRSLDKVLWQSHPETTPQGASVKLTYFSPDGEEGFPGNLHVSVRYTLTDRNALVITYDASTDIATPVNLTNHSYFNLGGHGSGSVLDHVLTIDSSLYTPTDDQLIPTGEIRSVEGTPLDFRQPTRIGDRIESVASTPAKGYDHNWFLRLNDHSIRKVARLSDPKSGRVMTVLTDQPGLQFYSGNFLNGQQGKGGKRYTHRSALCLETQHFPDAVNHAEFPSTILQPGDAYHTTTIYRFSQE